MRTIVSLAVACVLSAFLMMAGGCDKSTSPKTTASISFSSRYSAALPPALSVVGLGKSLGVAAVDSITITRARLVLKDIKFKSTVDSLNYKTGPTVLELSLAGGVQQLDVKDVPFATYQRIEFDVHRTDPSETIGMSSADLALLSDFLAGERYSIIVEGTVHRTGLSDTAFVYRSKVDAQQKYDLVPQLVISENSPQANVTFLISSGSWFKNVSGVLVDPNDPNNQGVIDENLKASIRIFKDNNKDGSKDAS